MRRLFLRTLVALSALLFLTSCSIEPQKSIKLAINPWVGYSPLIYIKEKQWLKTSDIEILNVVSLMESVKLLESGLISALGSTQQEYFHLNKTLKIVPAILLDRSNGADVLFSNLSIDELKKTTSDVNVYLEKGSVNDLMLEMFISNNDLQSLKLNIIDKDQYAISRLVMQKTPTIIVTYEPYVSDIKRKGYKKLASSKDENYLIFDAVFVKESVLKKNIKTFKELNDLILKALDDLRSDPKNYYETIKGYLDAQTYEEFTESLRGIEWIHGIKEKKIISELKNQRINTDWLINAN